MNKIYTRRGDTGETDLYMDGRISKDSPKVEAYGTLDEANAVIGFARALVQDEKIKEILYRIQKKFFILGGYLATDDRGKEKFQELVITEEKVQEFENIIDEYSKSLPPMKEFTIPGYDSASAALHMARTVVRRAERNIVRIKEQDHIPVTVLKFVNRISDLLFILARTLEEEVKHQEGASAAEEMGNKKLNGV